MSKLKTQICIKNNDSSKKETMIKFLQKDNIIILCRGHSHKDAFKFVVKYCIPFFLTYLKIENIENSMYKMCEILNDRIRELNLKGGVTITILFYCPAYISVGYIGQTYLYYSGDKQIWHNQIFENNHTTFNDKELKKFPTAIQHSSIENGTSVIRLAGKSLITRSIGDNEMPMLSARLDKFRIPVNEAQSLILSTHKFTTDLERLGSMKETLSEKKFFKYIQTLHSKTEGDFGFIYITSKNINLPFDLLFLKANKKEKNENEVI